MKLLIASHTARELASKCQGRLWGDPNFSIGGICSLESPRPGHIAFARVRSAKTLTKWMASLTDTALLVPLSLVEGEPPASAPRIGVPDPYTALLDLLPLFFEESTMPAGIHPSAIIDPSARIDESASVGPHCVVGAGCTVEAGVVLYPRVALYAEVTVGAGSVLHTGVVVRERCSIGKNCIVHNNTVIGADGFGYVPDPKVGLRKVPQVGTVEINDNVEIGANTCIDRGTFGSTVVGRGTKIDNLVQVGHNVVIGSHCIVCGQAGIGGSSVLGDRVVLGGASGVADHVTIITGTRVGARAGVHTSVQHPGDYSGFPLMPARAWRRAMAALLKDARVTDSSKAATKEDNS